MVVESIRMKIHEIRSDNMPNSTILTYNDLALILEEANDVIECLRHAYYWRDEQNKIQLQLDYFNNKTAYAWEWNKLQNPPTTFDLSQGSWAGRSLQSYRDEWTTTDLLEQVLPPYLNDMREVFLQGLSINGYALSEDVSADFIDQLLASCWMFTLKYAANLFDIAKKAGIPTPLPDMTNSWYVWVDGRLEVGSLEYVVSEYIKSGLCFGYSLMDQADAFGMFHHHEFQGILVEILTNPSSFTLKGHEEDYSEQEREFLIAFQKKLLIDKQDKPSKMKK